MWTWVSVLIYGYLLSPASVLLALVTISSNVQSRILEVTEPWQGKRKEALLQRCDFSLQIGKSQPVCCLFWGNPTFWHDTDFSDSFPLYHTMLNIHCLELKIYCPFLTLTLIMKVLGGKWIFLFGFSKSFWGFHCSAFICPWGKRKLIWVGIKVATFTCPTIYIYIFFILLKQILSTSVGG